METTVKCQRAEQNRILPCKIPQRGSTSSPAVPCSSCQLHGCTWGKKMLKVHIHVTKNWLTWFMFNDTDTKKMQIVFLHLFFRIKPGLLSNNYTGSMTIVFQSPQYQLVVKARTTTVHRHLNQVGRFIFSSKLIPAFQNGLLKNNLTQFKKKPH